MNTLNDYIVLLRDVVTPELCDEILAEYKNSDDWVNATTQDGEHLNIRNCTTIGISFSGVIQKNLTVRQSLDQRIFTCASKVIAEYNKLFPNCHIEQDNGYELLKYETGGFYTKHTDSFKEQPRAVSCSFALNDDYTGGEFNFFDGSVVHKIPKGAALLFPSNFMYPHEVMPVTSGTRYSIVTWFV